VRPADIVFGLADALVALIKQPGTATPAFTADDVTIFSEPQYPAEVEDERSLPQLAVIYDGHSRTPNQTVVKLEIDTNATDVQHTGSGASTTVLNDDCLGEWDIVVRVSTGGALGTAEVEISLDGGAEWTDPEVVPVSGVVFVERLHSITFDAALVLADTYAWETSPEILHYRRLSWLETSVNVVFRGRTRSELWGDGAGENGYLDQVIDWLEVNAGTVVLGEEQGMIVVDGSVRTEVLQDRQGALVEAWLPLRINSASYKIDREPRTATVEMA